MRNWPVLESQESVREQWPRASSGLLGAVQVSAVASGGPSEIVGIARGGALISSDGKLLWDEPRPADFGPH